jgi:transcriptional regulator with XRE-family HTH domain
MARTIKVHRSPKQSGPMTKGLLGLFIKAKRTQLGITLEDAALLCRVSKDTISRLENDREGVRLENALEVCRILGVELIVRPWE